MGKQLYLSDLQLKLIENLLDNSVDSGDYTEEEQEALGKLGMEVYKALKDE